MQNNSVIKRTLTLLEPLSNAAKCDIKSRLHTKASNTEQVFKENFKHRQKQARHQHAVTSTSSDDAAVTSGIGIADARPYAEIPGPRSYPIIGGLPNYLPGGIVLITCSRYLFQNLPGKMCVDFLLVEISIPTPSDILVVAFIGKFFFNWFAIQSSAVNCVSSQLIR